jgi:hypothetical protein
VAAGIGYHFILAPDDEPVKVPKKPVSPLSSPEEKAAINDVTTNALVYSSLIALFCVTSKLSHTSNNSH